MLSEWRKEALEEDNGQHKLSNLMASLIASVAVLQMAERKKP